MELMNIPLKGSYNEQNDSMIGLDNSNLNFLLVNELPVNNYPFTQKLTKDFSKSDYSTFKSPQSPIIKNINEESYSRDIAQQTIENGISHNINNLNSQSKILFNYCLCKN